MLSPTNTQHSFFFRRIFWSTFLQISLIASLSVACFLPYRTAINQTLWDITRADTLLIYFNPRDASIRFTLAQYYFNHGAYDIAKAKRYYQDTLEFDPDHLLAHYQLGRIYFIQGEHRQALNEINIVLNLDPEFEKGYYMYGLINGYSGNMRQAIYGFEEFIKRDDFNWAGYNDLAWVHFQLGDFEKTLEVAEKGLGKAYNNPWLLNMQGLALINLGQTEKAHQSFSKALERINTMTPQDWGIAYPGNDPRIYAEGLKRMQEAIEHNFELTQ